MDVHFYVNLLIIAWSILGLTILTTAVIGLPPYIQILLTSLCTIHIGSSFAVEWDELRDKVCTKADRSVEFHYLNSRELAMFPVIASCMLLLLYVLLKVVSEESINLVLYTYFALAGLWAVSSTIWTVVHRHYLDFNSWDILEFELLNIQFWTLEVLSGYMTISYFTVTLPNREGEGEEGKMSSLKLTPLVVICFFLAVFSIFWYHYQRLQVGDDSLFWMANNIQGIALSIQGIQVFRTGRLRDLALLLLAVFIYDVFWVFGTDVMITIAKKIDGPIKLVFPVAGTRPNLLGLGDIVLPGAFIAMILRFGLTQKGSIIYYAVAMLAYGISLLVTLGAMYYFDTAQPALFYLVPGLLSSSTILSLFRGEFKVFWGYEEVRDEITPEQNNKEE